MWRRRPIICTGIACFTAINRESGAFAGVAYFFLRAGNERPVRLLANSALLTIVPYVLAIAVRRYFYRGEIPATSMGQFLTGLPANFEMILTDIVRLNPWNDFYLLVAMTIFAVLVFARRPATSMK